MKSVKVEESLRLVDLWGMDQLMLFFCFEERKVDCIIIVVHT